MPDFVTISVDAMGGDHGPAVTLAGVDRAYSELPDTRYRLYGEAAQVEPALKAYPRLAGVATVIDCEVTVKMSDKPSQALRRGRWKSSMWRSIEAVKTGEADVAVSAGNTGALMAMARFCLRTMAGIERPAIAGLWPTARGESVVLDMGASIGADAQQLVDNAVMGGAMVRALYGKARPTVGLLNIGVEEVKGLEEVRMAGQLLREADMPNIDYVGFVEGNDIGIGTVDVVVTEGFSGNIALKTAEGTARQIASYLREEMGRSLRARIGYLLARPAFDSLRHKLDPARANGGVFLGLNGLVIKSHGGADTASFANAVKTGYAMVHNELQAKISHDLSLYPRAGVPLRAAMPTDAGAA